MGKQEGSATTTETTAEMRTGVNSAWSSDLALPGYKKTTASGGRTPVYPVPCGHPAPQYRAWTQEILPLINICQKGKKERRGREENNPEWLHVLASHWHVGLGDWLLWAEEKKKKYVLKKEQFLLASLKSTQKQTNTPPCFLVCPVTISLICLAGEPEAKSVASGATV